MPPSFASGTADVNAALSSATVGLVSKAEFTRRREELEKAAEPADEKKKKKSKKKKGVAANTLSFAEDEGEEGEEVVKRPKLGKNPSVDTGFLPDREREAAAEAKKAALAAEWQAEQDRVKAEEIGVTYSFWDGRGHRYETTVKKGWTIETFLNKCREQVKELRNCSPGDLMYVKEDLILPHSTSFYDLIVNKARLRQRVGTRQTAASCPRRIGLSATRPLGARQVGASLPVRRARRRAAGACGLAGGEGREPRGQGDGEAAVRAE